MNTSNVQLSSRMKMYEEEAEYIGDYDRYMIVRIDGHKFSSFTKGLIKPFDGILALAMEQTLLDLMERFTPIVGYWQSDEMTLVFPPIYQFNGDDVLNNQIYGSRTQKIASLVAAYTTLKFNTALNSLAIDYPRYANKLNTAFFDARVFFVPTIEEAYNCLLWRGRDAVKNSKAVYSQTYCDHKRLERLNVDEQISFCELTTGNDWNAIDEKFKYGMVMKRQPIKMSNENGEEYIRTKIVKTTDPLTTFTPDGVTKLLTRYELI